MRKKGYSIGFAWIVAIIALFAIGLLYIVFDQVMLVHIEPISRGLINQSTYLNATEYAASNAYLDKGMIFWDTVKYFMFFLIVLYLILVAIRGGKDPADTI